MYSSRLNNRADSHFRAQDQHEMENLGKKAWDNPGYNESPSTSLKIRAIYNPKPTLENPYQNIGNLGDPPPYQENMEQIATNKNNSCFGCFFHVFNGIRGKKYNRICEAESK
ncbi:hypothetical protein NDU88_009518 [Pleurodeles waltl]|uniref:Uncharacterized protein n=1 Tax=Pleurodeles waltl TaxID=8319 RepID=A0AAV7QUU5_PLEWA|nr:hypothetical protein NDU88_009518 [Pleurodeles waltl]